MRVLVVVHLYICESEAKTTFFMCYGSLYMGLMHVPCTSNHHSLNWEKHRTHVQSKLINFPLEKNKLNKRWLKICFLSVLPIRPKAREMTQHGVPPGWLEESDPAN
jgi:hypothetical protein